MYISVFFSSAVKQYRVKIRSQGNVAQLSGLTIVIVDQAAKNDVAIYS